MRQRRNAGRSWCLSQNKLKSNFNNEESCDLNIFNDTFSSKAFNYALNVDKNRSIFLPDCFERDNEDVLAKLKFKKKTILNKMQIFETLQKHKCSSQPNSPQAVPYEHKRSDSNGIKIKKPAVLPK